jgi:hypothetical protein
MVKKITFHAASRSTRQQEIRNGGVPKSGPSQRNHSTERKNSREKRTALKITFKATARQGHRKAEMITL